MPDSIARMSGSTEKWHTTGVAGDATRNKSHSRSKRKRKIKMIEFEDIFVGWDSARILVLVEKYLNVVLIH